jgi:RNA polymerase sigma factor (sigma-70 family)
MRLTAELMLKARQWARRNMPSWLRGRVDLEDLVQEAIVRALEASARPDERHIAASEGYLLTILKNRIRDEIRSARAAPARGTLRDDFPSPARSPFEMLSNRQLVQRYRVALHRLPPHMRDAFALRVEAGCSFRRVAELLGCRSSDAARMLVSRGRRRLIALLRAIHSQPLVPVTRRDTGRNRQRGGSRRGRRMRA